MPQKAQNAVHRIENRLSDQPSSIGMMAAEQVQTEMKNPKSEEQAMYTLGKTFGSQARKLIKRYEARMTLRRD